jgi:hypothetical protein
MTPEQAQQECDRVRAALGITEWAVRLETYPSEQVNPEEGTSGDCHADASTLSARVRIALGAEDPFAVIVHEYIHILLAEVDYAAGSAFELLGKEAGALASTVFHERMERVVWRLDRLLVPLLRVDGADVPGEATFAEDAPDFEEAVCKVIVDAASRTVRMGDA